MKTLDVSNIPAERLGVNIADLIDGRIILLSSGINNVIDTEYNMFRTSSKFDDNCKPVITLKLLNISTGDVEYVKIVYDYNIKNIVHGSERDKHYIQFIKVIKTVRESTLHGDKRRDEFMSIIKFLGLPYDVPDITSLTPYSDFYTRLKDLPKDGHNLMEYRDTLKSKWDIVYDAMKDPNHVWHFISSKIDVIPYRYNDNLNEKTFDGFNVHAPLIGDNGNTTFDQLIDKFKQHKNEIDNVVMTKLKNSPKFTKYEVPINFLKLDRIQVLRSFVAIYTFSIKEHTN